MGSFFSHVIIDMGVNTMTYQKDKRLEKVEQITIDFKVFKKALARNYLGESNKTDRNYVLRLYPDFEKEMEVEYYESVNGVHYDNNWDEKPFHIPPELIILEGTKHGFRNIVTYPDEWEVRNALSEEEIEEEGGIENALQEGKEIFWDDIKYNLPKKYNLANGSYYVDYVVDLNWINL